MAKRKSNPDAVETLTFTIEEAAVALGISRAMAYELANIGKLPGPRRLGHRFVVSRKAIEQYLDGNADRT